MAGRLVVARVFEWSAVLALTPPEINWWYVQLEQSKAADRLAFMTDTQLSVASLFAGKESGDLRRTLQEHSAQLSAAAGYTEKP